MAEEKYAKAKCFILSPEGYQEISYLELCRRRDMEPDYQNRKFIPCKGMNFRGVSFFPCFGNSGSG